MRFLVRCDGSPTIGMGHVVRSSALACALRERGAVVEFAMRSDALDGIRAVQALEFLTRELPPSGEETFLELAKGYDVVIVDHYAVESAVLERLSKRALLGVIDDEGTRDFGAASWLLNQNLGAGGLSYRTSKTAVCLFGPRFALLRPAFRVARQRLRRVFDAAASRLLLTFGGGAVEEHVRRALQALGLVERHLEVVVLGSDVVDVRSTHEVRFVRTQAVDEYMTWCDVAVSAGGSTCWELCSLGVPFIAIPIAMNQELVVRGLGGAGAAVAADSFPATAELAGMVSTLFGNPRMRQRLSEKALELVDGLGAARAAQSLLHLARGES